MAKSFGGLELNNEQIEAIKFASGPLLIIAGAGTGKTTVITERIKHLIVSGLAKPEEILALTFTEKGASEMEERIDIALPLSYGDLWVSTFHSFCDRILRESGIHIGLSSKYKLMTQAQCVDLIRKNLFDFNLDYFRPLGNPNKFIEGLLQHFSRLQDELVLVDDYLKYSNAFKSDEKLEIKKTKELADAYKTYTELKLKENVLDFADLIIYTNKLFVDRSNILKIYQEKFKYILVDEFQDTNYAQNELIVLLTKRHQNITVVADDDQSIYRFRGASVSNVVQFRKAFPKTKIVVLTKNYRSTQEILDRSYALIQHNNPDRLEVVEKINKKLIAINKGKTDKIKFIHTNNSQDEAEEVVKEIIQLTSKDYDYKDIAILIRANNHADGFIRELERRGIPHQFLGPEKLFEKKEIVDLISYLKVLNNPEDSEFFYRLLTSDIYNISPLDLIKVTSKAKKESKSIFEIILDDEKYSKIISVIDKHLKVINTDSAGHILYDYINEIGLIKKLVKDSDEIAAKNISKFFEKVKSYEESNKDAGVAAIVSYIDLLTEVGESPSVTDGDWQDNNAVNILTVHSSKGLEFPVVFLVNLVNERFPSRERHEQIPIPEELIKEVLPQGDYHLQEERRLFYVGMTRAKERLYFTGAQYYGDGKRAKKISPFVFEALGEITNYQLPITNQLQIKNYKISKQKPTTNNQQQITVDYLSVSQIETFKTCPMHYKLRYIYKLPIPPFASISFGISIHNTLKDYFVTKTDILDLYKENWIEEGYLNKKHKLEFFKKGESYLLGFLKNGYNSKIKAIALEEKFTLGLDKTLKIGGTIDRIDDLGGGRYEIIDYKTGANIPKQKEVDNDLQLSVYAMAAANLYNVDPENISLSLYYLDTQEKFTTKRTKKDLEKVKQDILEVRDEIQNSDFKCNNNYFCQSKCEFSMFCKSDQ